MEKTKTLDPELPYWVYEALEDTATKVHWVTGGLGSGKTTGGTVWAISRALQNAEKRAHYPPTVSWDVAPTYGKVEDILMRSYDEVLPMYFDMLPDRDYAFVRGKRPKLKFLNHKHEIHFHSGDRPRLMVGTNTTHYRITEPGIQKREVFDKCGDRCRDPRAEVRQGLGEGTPEGANWYMDVANFRDYDPVNKFRRFILETADNDKLPGDYVYDLRLRYAYDPQKLLSYEKGLFVPFTHGSAYWEFFESRNVLSRAFATMPELPIALCWDFNKSPLACSTMQRVTVTKNYERRFKYVSLWEASGMSRGLMDACVEFAVAHPTSRFADTPIELYGGHDGWNGGHNIATCDFETIKRLLEGLGYRKVTIKAKRSAPGIRDSLNMMAALMTYELYLVSPSCPKLINSYGKTALKKGTWDFEKPNDDTWTHWADGPRYYLMQVHEGTNIVDPNYRPKYGVNI